MGEHIDKHKIRIGAERISFSKIHVEISDFIFVDILFHGFTGLDDSGAVVNHLVTILPDV